MLPISKMGKVVLKHLKQSEHFPDLTVHDQKGICQVTKDHEDTYNTYP